MSTLHRFLRHGTWDKRLFMQAVLLALLSAPAAPVWPGPLKAACELIGKTEVAKALGADVTIVEDASGPDPKGGDNCVWKAGNRNAAVRVVMVKDRNFVDYTFTSIALDAYGTKRPPEIIARVGDEARYRTYDGNLMGGVVVGRKGNVIFVVEGNANRENLLDLARAILSRM